MKRCVALQIYYIKPNRNVDESESRAHSFHPLGEGSSSNFDFLSACSEALTTQERPREMLALKNNDFCGKVKSFFYVFLRILHFAILCMKTSLSTGIDERYQ